MCPEQREEEEGGLEESSQNKPSRQMVNTDQRECEEEGEERRGEESRVRGYRSASCSLSFPAERRER